jgi:hypothetical protein
MRISRPWELRRKILAEDGASSALPDFSWRYILHPFKRQTTRMNGMLLHRQPSDLLPAPYDSYSQTPRTSIDLAAYYSAKPLPPTPSPESSLFRGYTTKSYASPSVSSATSSPSRSTTTCSSPVIRPQTQERLILTPTSRYSTGIGSDLYEPEYCEVSKKKQGVAKKFSSKSLRGKTGAKDTTSFFSPPLPNRVAHDSYLV